MCGGFSVRFRVESLRQRLRPNLDSTSRVPSTEPRERFQCIKFQIVICMTTHHTTACTSCCRCSLYLCGGCMLGGYVAARCTHANRCVPYIIHSHSTRARNSRKHQIDYALLFRLPFFFVVVFFCVFFFDTHTTHKHINTRSRPACATERAPVQCDMPCAPCA